MGSYEGVSLPNSGSEGGNNYSAGASGSGGGENYAANYSSGEASSFNWSQSNDYDWNSPGDVGWGNPASSLNDFSPSNSNNDAWYGLKSGVGWGEENDRLDVAKIETTLGATEHYDVAGTNGPTGYAGNSLVEGIKEFQKQNGLDNDGVIKRDGPTLKALKGKTGHIFGEYPSPSLEEIDKHHESVAKDEKPLLQHRPPVPKIQPLPDLPVIDDEDQGAIGRSIKYLTGYSDPGGHPEDTARIIKDVGDYGIAYARELVSQLQEADSGLGDKYLTSLAGLLSSDLQEKFLGGPMPENIPIGVPLYALEAKNIAQDQGQDVKKDENPIAWLDEKSLSNLAELGRRQANGEFEREEANSRDNLGTFPALSPEALAELKGDKTPAPGVQYAMDGSRASDVNFDSRGEVDKKIIPPTINLGKDRIRNIIEDRPARFDINDQKIFDGSAPLWRKDKLGIEAVVKYGSIAEKEAKAQGVDPNLVKAILYYENADGHRFGGNSLADRIGVSGSVMPMNINPEIWKDLGINRKTASDPETNIRASVTLIKRISERIDDPTSAKIGSLWNGITHEHVNERGARIGKIYEGRPWENLAKYYLEHKK
jgi:hypothetical protein